MWGTSGSVVMTESWVSVHDSANLCAQPATPVLHLCNCNKGLYVRVAAF